MRERGFFERLPPMDGRPEKRPFSLMKDSSFCSTENRKIQTGLYNSELRIPIMFKIFGEFVIPAKAGIQEKPENSTTISIKF